ncbi:hypothetical protein CPSG_07510 [Coccidioides posadasii str. Silveira]|uniref:Uncharacterized protein n=1 Tax=Coccidioides posadasii (strain RMSCC 757 / Silveira) TaxID=443226 RepID=E9DCF8_COCPS|nr:hypothetical protein CPSG_07510 [Coccidioides posadasii str. Silveira]
MSMTATLSVELKRVINSVPLLTPPRSNLSTTPGYPCRCLSIRQKPDRHVGPIKRASANSLVARNNSTPPSS